MAAHRGNAAENTPRGRQGMQASAHPIILLHDGCYISALHFSQARAVNRDRLGVAKGCSLGLSSARVCTPSGVHWNAWRKCSVRQTLRPTASVWGRHQQVDNACRMRARAQISHLFISQTLWKKHEVWKSGQRFHRVEETEVCNLVRLGRHPPPSPCSAASDAVPQPAYLCPRPFGGECVPLGAGGCTRPAAAAASPAHLFPFNGGCKQEDGRAGASG